MLDSKQLESGGRRLVEASKFREVEVKADSSVLEKVLGLEGE